MYRIYTSDKTIIVIRSEIHVDFSSSVQLKDLLNIFVDLNIYKSSKTFNNKIVLPYALELWYKYLLFKCGPRVSLQLTNMFVVFNSENYQIVELINGETINEVEYGDLEMQMADYLQDVSYMVHVINNFPICDIIKHPTKILDLITYYHLIPRMYQSLPGLVLSHNTANLTTSRRNVLSDMLHRITMGYFGRQRLEQRTLHDICSIMYNSEIADFVQIIDPSKYSVIFCVVVNEILSRTDQGKLHVVVRKDTIKRIIKWEQQIRKVAEENKCVKLMNILYTAADLRISRTELEEAGVDHSVLDIVREAEYSLSQGELEDVNQSIEIANTMLRQYFNISINNVETPIM